MAYRFGIAGVAVALIGYLALLAGDGALVAVCYGLMGICAYECVNDSLNDRRR